MIPTNEQIREGRGLIGTRRDAIAIQRILEAAGVEFVRENGSIGVHRRPTDGKDGGV